MVARGELAGLWWRSGPLVSVDIAETPRNVQHVSGDAIARQHGVGLNEALNARLGSATINDVQNNPLQPDFQFRGFTASPLLGTPQGIAVYQNGVRINEPFGDVFPRHIREPAGFENDDTIARRQRVDERRFACAGPR